MLQSLLTSEDEIHPPPAPLDPADVPPRADRVLRGVDGPVRRAGRDRWSDGEGRPADGDGGAHARGVGDTLFGTDVDERRSATVRRALTDTLGMFDHVYSPLFRLLVRLPSPTMRRYRRVESDLNRVIAEMIAERREAGATGDDLLSLLLRARGRSRHERRAGPRRGPHAVPRGTRDHGDRAHVDMVAPVVEPGGRGAAPRGSTRRSRARALDRGPAEPPLHPSRGVRVDPAPPPAWAIGRTAVADHRANDVRSARLDRRGFALAPAPRSPWWPEPEVFRPERWLADRDRTSPYAFIPFGGGPRVCIGEPFARLEATMLLGTIARRWRFASRSDRVPDIQAVITLRPRGGLPMVAVRR